MMILKAVCAILLTLSWLFNSRGHQVKPAIRIPFEDCIDQKSMCITWSLRGECYQNRGYMYIYCPRACGQCRVRDLMCVDHERHCPAWADQGECAKNRSFMKKACRRACSFCLPTIDKSLPFIRSNVVDEFWDGDLPDDLMLMLDFALR